MVSSLSVLLLINDGGLVECTAHTQVVDIDRLIRIVQGSKIYSGGTYKFTEGNESLLSLPVISKPATRMKYSESFEFDSPLLIL